MGCAAVHWPSPSWCPTPAVRAPARGSLTRRSRSPSEPAMRPSNPRTSFSRARISRVKLLDLAAHGAHLGVQLVDLDSGLQAPDLLAVFLAHFFGLGGPAQAVLHLRVGGESCAPVWPCTARPACGWPAPARLPPAGCRVPARDPLLVGTCRRPVPSARSTLRPAPRAGFRPPAELLHPRPVSPGMGPACSSGRRRVLPPGTRTRRRPASA